ncbi:OsmC family protein [Pontibacter silvestris]|uniref:OsmC family protein n=1 Tax=Pontibacter silvestris TaxID=2305183 RepID=A0ABW4WXH0_9BACT|nr:OsmC family protein [Pontibacter silvestris]MCC9138728.1 OsmC family protein [Pontibacter silvestris]
MKKHRAEARWEKSLKEGSGQLSTGSGALKASYSFASRFGDDTKGTTPEELIGAAHAGCFSMFLSALLGNENLTPDYVQTQASVHLGEQDGGPLITKIELTTEAKVPGLQNDDFQRLVAQAKANCPVSKALASVPEITVQATLQE